jgi:benzaldehyde dehydrogenase (NAD)
MNAGQICMSTERIVADKTVASELLDKLAERADALVTGDPSSPETQIGPVVNEDAAKHVSELIADAKEKGARIVAGGDADGTMLRPTVISGVTTDMRIYGEESFGPVVAVIEVDGTDEAIAVANDTEYGLAAAVFGKDVNRAMGVASKIESGICHINGSTVHDEPSAPFGGVKHSGWGRFGAGQVLHEFTDLRWITISEQERQYPI